MWATCVGKEFRPSKMCVASIPLVNHCPMGGVSCGQRTDNGGAAFFAVTLEEGKKVVPHENV